jgi:hypothetical protein
MNKNFFLAITIFLAGCEVKNICDITPNVMPKNQSNIYTLAMTVRGTDGDILQKSIKPYVVVNGEKNEMEKHPDENNVFVYDYHFDGIGIIPYYFELVYEMNRNGNMRTKTEKSDLFQTTVTDKYIFALDAHRGPVGTQVNIVGSGLARTDRVRFGGRVVPAEWLSTGSIAFTVPSVECDSEYEVNLLVGQKELYVGTFFVDVSTLHCSTDFIRLANGESQRLVFMLDYPANQEGVNVDITTDIPNSIVMPEVRFGAGERTVSINISGSEESGKGLLFVNAKGFSPLKIPVEIGDIEGGKFFENSSPTPPSQVFPENSDDSDVVVL